MNNLEKILDYLQGELTEDETKTFEKKLKNEPQLAKEVEFFKDVHDDYQRIAFEESLKEFHNNYKLKQEAKIIKWPKPYLVAAAIVSFLLIATFVILQFSTNQSKKLAREIAYQTPQDISLSAYLNNDITIIDNYAQFLEDVTLVTKSYNEGAYQRAASLLEGLKGNFPDESPLNYMLAMSYIQTDSTDKAIDVLNNIVKEGQSQFVEEGRLKLAALYVLDDKPDRAKTLLQELDSSDEQEIKEKANQLLQKL